MLSKKKDLKYLRDGVAGKYVKKETPPHLPDMDQCQGFVLFCLNPNGYGSRRADCQPNADAVLVSSGRQCPPNAFLECVCVTPIVNTWTAAKDRTSQGSLEDEAESGASEPASLAEKCARACQNRASQAASLAPPMPVGQGGGKDHGSPLGPFLRSASPSQPLAGPGVPPHQGPPSLSPKTGHTTSSSVGGVSVTPRPGTSLPQLVPQQVVLMSPQQGSLPLHAHHYINPYVGPRPPFSLDPLMHRKGSGPFFEGRHLFGLCVMPRETPG
ncbi:scaffold protein salvador [Ixodes scapularis]